MDISISQFPEHVGKDTSGSWCISQFRLHMICLILTMQMPREEYLKIGHDLLAFLHPFCPAVSMLHNFSISTGPVSHFNMNVRIMVFGVTSLCSVVGVYWCFVGICCFHPQNSILTMKALCFSRMLKTTSQPA